MNSILKVIFLLPVVALSFCTNGETSHEETKKNIMNADRIEYSFHGGSVAPKYYRSYTITITPDKLEISINNRQDTLLRKSRTFTPEKFEELKQRFKNIAKKGNINDADIPNGGTSRSIVFYKGNDLLFSAEDYGGDARDYKGADIDLTSLVPDLQDLIDSTKKENTDDSNSNDETQDDYNGEDNT